MNCPACTVPLNMAERQGIEIDYCPQCRGIWLDRGELDKIIEKSVPANPQRVSNESQSQYQEPQTSYHKHDDDHGYGHQGKKKRKSFLGDLFDF